MSRECLTLYLSQMLAACGVQPLPVMLQRLKETFCCCHLFSAHPKPVTVLLWGERSHCLVALFTL